MYNVQCTVIVMVASCKASLCIISHAPFLFWTYLQENQISNIKCDYMYSVYYTLYCRLYKKRRDRDGDVGRQWQWQWTKENEDKALMCTFTHSLIHIFRVHLLIFCRIRIIVNVIVSDSFSHSHPISLSPPLAFSL